MLLIIIIIVLLVVGSNKRKKIGNKATNIFTVACVLSVLNVASEIYNYLQLIATLSRNEIGVLSNDQTTNVMVVTTLVIIAEIGLMVACFKMRNETKLMDIPDLNEDDDVDDPSEDDEEISIFKESEPNSKPKIKKSQSKSQPKTKNSQASSKTKSKTTSKSSSSGDAKLISAFFAEEEAEKPEEDDGGDESEKLDYNSIADEIYDISMKLQDDIADGLSKENNLDKSNKQVAGPSRGYAKMFFNLGAKTLADRLDEIDGDVNEMAKEFANKRGDVTVETMKKYAKMSYSDTKELRDIFERMDDETGIPSRKYLQEVSDAIENFINQEI